MRLWRLAVVLSLGLGCASERAVHSGDRAEQVFADVVMPSTGMEDSRVASSRRDTLAWYQEFIERQQQELAKPGTSERDRRVGQESIWCMRERMYGGSQSALERTSPEELLLRCRAKALSEMHHEEEVERAKEVKREEYWRWALRQWGEGSLRFERPGRA